MRQDLAEVGQDIVDIKNTTERLVSIVSNLSDDIEDLKIVGRDELTTDQVKKLVIAQIKEMKHFDFDITEILPKRYCHDFVGSIGVS